MHDTRCNWVNKHSQYRIENHEIIWSQVCQSPKTDSTLVSRKSCWNETFQMSLKEGCQPFPATQLQMKAITGRQWSEPSSVVRFCNTFKDSQTWYIRIHMCMHSYISTSIYGYVYKQCIYTCIYIFNFSVDNWLLTMCQTLFLVPHECWIFQSAYSFY